MGTTLSRRQFLTATGASALALSLGQLEWAAVAEGQAAAAAGAAASIPPYRTWEDLYRKQWVWDKVVRSSHWVNCWYQAHCAWNVFVKDGVVWKEEQASDYPQTRKDVSDFNPRGCQKGACYSERMYDPTRIKWPLKRVGERGSGKWERLSWDQALTEIADSMLDTIDKEGSDRIIWDLGPGISLGTQMGGQGRLQVLLDSTALDMNTEIGDGHRGTAETFGKIVFERSGDDYFFSDLILIWGGNPLYTQIPNAHFLTEARYKGAEIYCISPDYSASSIRSDRWIPVKPGGDAALALGVAHVLIAENLVDKAFVREQTDLPILVREDTKRFLRGSDLKSGGDGDELYVHDAKKGIIPVNKRTLALEGLEPSLEGRFEATLANGKKVNVRPVFELLREHLAAYTPDKAAALAGTPASLIQDLARRMAKSKATSMVTTSNFAKYYHGNLVERSQALVFALTGNFGKKGSGFVGFPFMTHDGLEKFAIGAFGLGVRGLIGAMGFVEEKRLQMAGYTDEMMIYERSRGSFETGRAASGAMFWYVHGGLLEASEKLQAWDPYLKRPVRDVLKESLDKKWQYVWPKPGNDPRVLFSLVSNPLRRIRAYPLLLKNLWPKLRTVVNIDWRMTSTSLMSDYLLPAAGWYERTELKWVTPLMPFIHAGEKVTTFHEAKSDWEICALLAKKVDERAAARGIKEFKDRTGRTRSLAGLYEQFTSSGEYGPTDDDKVARFMVENSSNLEGVKWDDLKKKGYARFTGVGTSIVSVGNATKVTPNDTITPLTEHVFDKKVYPTLSRRIQFYIDQDLYAEMGEMLPVHKDPPSSGGKYPLQLTGGHTRWSIHAAWRDSRIMLRSQRGEPVAYMSPVDAAARGIADGDHVRVHNDLDDFQIMVKVAPSIRPGQFIVYHAWENYQFKGQKGFQNLIATPLNPVELSGGQFHLRPMSICLQPSLTDRDTRIEVSKI